MRSLSLTLLLVLTTAGLLSQPVAAGTMFSGDQEIETKYRTKIMKEKAKQATESIQNQRQNNNDNNQSNADCGSQNIGNVDTGGRAGNQPREVFVFAPNSINVVGSRACN